jgi:hypothetical protein
MGAEDSKFASSVQRLHDRIEKIRPPLPKDDPAEAARLRDLYILRAPTSLQGTALTDRSLPVNRAIEFFINRRLIERREQLAWWNQGRIVESSVERCAHGGRIVVGWDSVPTGRVGDPTYAGCGRRSGQEAVRSNTPT